MSGGEKPDSATAIKAMLKASRWKFLKTLKRDELAALELSPEERVQFKCPIVVVAAELRVPAPEQPEAMPASAGELHDKLMALMAAERSLFDAALKRMVSKPSGAKAQEIEALFDAAEAREEAFKQMRFALTNGQEYVQPREAGLDYQGLMSILRGDARSNDGDNVSDDGDNVSDDGDGSSPES